MISVTVKSTFNKLLPFLMKPLKANLSEETKMLLNLSCLAFMAYLHGPVISKAITDLALVGVGNIVAIVASTHGFEKDESTGHIT